MDFTMIFHDFPMDFPWIFHDFPMIIPGVARISEGFVGIHGSSGPSRFQRPQIRDVWGGARLEKQNVDFTSQISIYLSYLI